MRLAPNDCWLKQAESRHFRLVYLSLCLNILSLVSRGLTYLDLLVDRTVIIYPDLWWFSLATNRFFRLVHPSFCSMD